MKRILLLAFGLIMSSNVFAQYQQVSIKDIQYLNPDSLQVYFDDDVPGPYEGDTVSVKGIVMIPPYKHANPDSGTLIYLGSLAGFFMQDSSDTEWGGILVAINNPANYPEFQFLDSGTVVNVTGVVTSFANATQKTTELILTDFTVDNIIGSTPTRQPVVLTLDSLKELGTSNSLAISEKWEGVLVEIRNVKTLDRNWTSGGFRIIDDNNTIASIYSRSNNIFGSNPPADNTVLDYVRGYIETRSESSGGATINPMYLTDYHVASFPPTIADVTRDPVEVGYGEQVNITATISDQDGSVANAVLHYRINQSNYGVTTMTNSSGDNWTAVLPAQNDSTLVDFYITAQDNAGNISNNPSDTTRNRYFYLVLNRDLVIQDVQFSPFLGGFSGYNGYSITVTGVVTADTSDIEGNETGTPSNPQVYIQNGQGAWSGIHIYGTEVTDLVRGDNVTVTGSVFENFGVTQIGDNTSGASVVINSSGNALPDPADLSTSEIDDLSNGVMQAEQWEGVLVRYSNVTVTDENADGNPGPHSPPSNNNFGDILVADASNSNTRVDLQDGTHDYHNFWNAGQDTVPIYIQQGFTLESVTGIVWYSFSHYKLIPRKNDDFSGLTGVKNEHTLPESFTISQNYPNPFNPSTKIKYTLPLESNVTIKIYNVLGEEIVTLINNELKSAGEYTVDFNASYLPSGIYFYRIEAGSFVQVKKMMLLK
jgi:Secretion system C-terminal sorting domain